MSGNEWSAVVADVLVLVLRPQMQYSVYDVILQQGVYQGGGGAACGALLENLVTQGPGSESFQVTTHAGFDFITGGTEIAGLYFSFRVKAARTALVAKTA